MLRLEQKQLYDRIQMGLSVPARRDRCCILLTPLHAGARRGSAGARGPADRVPAPRHGVPLHALRALRPGPGAGAGRARGRGVGQRARRRAHLLPHARRPTQGGFASPPSLQSQRSLGSSGTQYVTGRRKAWHRHSLSVAEIRSASRRRRGQLASLRLIARCSQAQPLLYVSLSPACHHPTYPRLLIRRSGTEQRCDCWSSR